MVGELADLLRNASLGGSEERPRKNPRASPVASSAVRESRCRVATNSWLPVEDEEMPSMMELGSEIASSMEEHNEAFG